MCLFHFPGNGIPTWYKANAPDWTLEQFLNVSCIFPTLEVSNNGIAVNDVQLLNIHAIFTLLDVSNKGTDVNDVQ